MSTLSAVPQILDDKTRDLVAKAKIFVVGAGGIGCEILKNLALSGFNDIEIIDLDTIDVSNLNRQFLFRKEHVGKSKALVAKDSILQYNPDIKIEAYHDSITTQRYGVNFFKKFNLVLNALDNRAARNHVNRMCLNANVPLIDSGTAGYNGQVELIKKGYTACYECFPKDKEKTFPGCTIRNTPSEPVHCIVWAKHLFNQLFGEADPDQDVSPDTEDPEAAGDAGTKALNNDGEVNRVSTRQWAQETEYNPEKLFNKFFNDDIKYLLSMGNLWTSRKKPTPLCWENVIVSEDNDLNNDDLKARDMQVWSLSKCAKIFASTIDTLKKQLETKDFLMWDKDDNPAMDFVTACANIRANIFSIPQKSRFDIKSIAGNIIPAIATTNAMIAGLVVLYAFRVLAEEYEKCASVNLRQKSVHTKTVVSAEKSLIPPLPNCYVCSEKPFVNIFVNVNKMTIKELESEILKKNLNMIAPDAIIDGKGVIIISSEEGETEVNNSKTMAEMGILDGSLLKVDDFLQNYELTVAVNHYVPAEKTDPLYKIVSEGELKAKEKTDDKNNTGDEAMQQDEEDDDDIVVVDLDDPQEGSSAKRRKLDDDDCL